VLAPYADLLKSEPRSRADLYTGRPPEAGRTAARRYDHIMPTATVRFHGSLNDFLPATRRDLAIEYGFDGGPAIKDAIEALASRIPRSTRSS